MSLLRAQFGWGGLATVVSVASGCSLVTSLSGLTGGDGSTRTSGASDGGGTLAQAFDATASGGGTGPPDAAAENDGTSPTAPNDAKAPVDATPPLACTSGKIACSGVCVDPTSDAMNCDGCGNVCGSGLGGTSISAPMTSAPAHWNFNGSAVFNSSAPSAELTLPEVDGQAGTFVYAHPVVVDGLDVVFEFRLGLDGGLRSDGMGFLLQTQGATAVGSAGSGLGWQAFPAMEWNSTSTRTRSAAT